jgi:hypothetical protein
MPTTLPESFAFTGADGPTKETGEQFTSGDANLLIANDNLLLQALKAVQARLAALEGPAPETVTVTAVTPS